MQIYDLVVAKVTMGMLSIKDKLREKVNGDSQLVVALVLIAVAIGLCIVFRNTINNTMKTLFNKIDGQITNLTNGGNIVTG